MGVSLGGMIAQHFAATWPDRVHRLVLADTAARFSRAARDEWQTRAATARKHGTASLLPMIEKTWFTPDFAARTPPEPEVQLVRESFQAGSAEGYAQACEALAAADLSPLAERIKAPTLVLCGRESASAFRDAAHWLGAHIAGSSVEFVEGAAHASVLEQSEAVAARLLSFLG
jgi:pimeloyl-ACP methyl ester carboxylesterase